MKVFHALMQALMILGLGLTTASGCATLGGRSSDDATFVARKRLVRELMVRGEWANAFAHADEMHRQQPDDAEVLVLRGTIFRERKLVDEAEADLRAALAAAPASAEAHAGLGILLDNTGRGAEAETHHRKAVAADGKNAAYLNNLGFSLLVRKRTRDALEILQRAARLDPTNRRLRTNLGFAYAAAGDLPRAAREFQLGATAAEAKNNLGFAYEARGDLANAFELYAQAVRLDPACRRARSNLGYVATRLGRPLPPEIASDTPAAPSPSPASSPSSSPSPEQMP